MGRVILPLTLKCSMFMPVTARCVKNGLVVLRCTWKPAVVRLWLPIHQSPLTSLLLCVAKRYFCSGCGCPLWFRLTESDRYFMPWTLLELTEDERRRLILAAEIYTETQPAFWRLTGQYARLSGKEIEAMDYPCQLAH
ncbi:Uncharacterised protein [Citrobacter koseri]|uniref:Uncharacterized protein n=1 Tax=Citrobacter koseri TaxID=545 RepID=A0A3S4M246_CITKO|nr:Uncharacterised protein [Citrobacter koseri]